MIYILYVYHSPCSSLLWCIRVEKTKALLISPIPIA